MHGSQCGCGQREHVDTQLVVDGGLTWDLNVLAVPIIGTARSSLETEEEGSKRCQKEPGEFVGNH